MGGPSWSVSRTLLLPPRLPARCLPRVALVDRLREASAEPLTLVLAGAGYGKTTLLAQARDADPRPWIWVSCDERLDGPGALLAHVAAAFQRRYPGVGSRLAFSGAPGEDAPALADELAETVPDDVVVAIDDVHLVPGAAREAVLRLAADLPPHVHLVLASRTSVAPAARLRARHVVELGEEALALDADEGAALLAVLDPTMDERTAHELHERTEGWISGLILAAGSRRRDRPEPSVGHEDSFDYLAEEVLAGQPAHVRRFLIDSSVLERFTPDIAAAVTGQHAARDVLAGLLRSHLFTVRLDVEGSWYRYHHLFRTFLRRTAGGADPAPLHRRAAAACAAAGEPALAVHHHLAAGDRDAAAAALEPIAEALVRGPSSEQVAGWLDAMGRDVWSSRPALVLAHASLRFAHSDPVADSAPLAEAAEELVAVGEHDRAAAAYFRLVQALIWAGGAREPGIELGERLLPRMPPGTALLPAAEIMLAGLHAQVGRYEDAERGLAAALARPGTREYPAFRAYAAINRAFFLDYRRGHVEIAVRDLDTAVTTLEAADDVLAYRSWAYSYRGVLLGGLGRWDEALRTVHRFPEAAVAQGFGRLVEQVATWHGLVHLAGAERWAELEAELRRARPLVAAHPATTYAVRYRTATAQLAAHRGDRAEVARAVDEVRSAPLSPYPRAVILGDLAESARRAELPGLAVELADEAWRAARSVDAPWPLLRACLLGAAARDEDDVRADELLAEGLTLTERWGYQEMWSRRERGLAAGLLVRALCRGLGPAGVAARVALACGDDVARSAAERLGGAPAAARRELVAAARDADVVDPALLRGFRDDADPEVRRLAEHAHTVLAARARPGVRVVSLGGFAVHRRGALLPGLGFGRRKARALLAALLAGDGPVHRDVLVEWLWPDLTPARAVAALHTTLHALRQGLQAGLGPAAADLVSVDGEHYHLALGPGDEWDAAQFLAAVRAVDADPGPARLERAAVAETRYTGAFLPEWPYEPWAQEQRDHLERAYCRVLEVAAEDLTRAGRPAAAVRRYELLLDRAPEREAWHRGLMRAYAQAGERGLALRQYHACRVLLRDTLGVDPSAQTQDLYRALL